MRFILRFFIIIMVLTISGETSWAQRSSYVKYPFLRGFSVSPKIGVNSFWGDLVDERPINLMFGLSSEKELKEYLNVRVDFKYGTMSGTQINPSNGLPFSTFENSYYTAEAGVAFHPLPLFFGFFKQRKFKPYVVGQLGLIGYDAVETFGEGNGYKYEDGTPAAEGDVWHSTYGYEMSTVFTLGGGLNYYINKKLSLSLEFLFSAPLTDMLDAHEAWEAGGVINSPSVPSNPTTANTALVETDGTIDPYYTGTFSINYTFAESEFKNQFKYNRKAYLQTRKSMKVKNKKTTRYYNKKNRKR